MNVDSCLARMLERRVDQLAFSIGKVISKYSGWKITEQGRLRGETGHLQGRAPFRSPPAIVVAIAEDI